MCRWFFYGQLQATGTNLPIYFPDGQIEALNNIPFTDSTWKTKHHFSEFYTQRLAGAPRHGVRVYQLSSEHTRQCLLYLYRYNGTLAWLSSDI